MGWGFPTMRDKKDWLCEAVAIELPQDSTLFRGSALDLRAQFHRLLFIAVRGFGGFELPQTRSGIEQAADRASGLGDLRSARQIVRVGKALKLLIPRQLTPAL